MNCMFFLNFPTFPPEPLYSMASALNSNTTAVAVMIDATMQDQSTEGAISCHRWRPVGVAIGGR